MKPTFKDVELFNEVIAVGWSLFFVTVWYFKDLKLAIITLVLLYSFKKIMRFACRMYVLGQIEAAKEKQKDYKERKFGETQKRD